MNTKLIYISVLIAVTFAFLVQVVECKENSKFLGADTLGGFSLNGTLMKEKDFIEKYGCGTEVLGLSDSHGFNVPEQKCFVYFMSDQYPKHEIWTIFVSQAPHCECAKKESKIKFQNFTTAEGVGLGDSYEKLISTYGKPTFHEEGKGYNCALLTLSPTKSKFACDEVIGYRQSNDDLLMSNFYLKDKKIIAIEVSDSE